jgi:hypothetical protein
LGPTWDEQHRRFFARGWIAAGLLLLAFEFSVSKAMQDADDAKNLLILVGTAKAQIDGLARDTKGMQDAMVARLAEAQKDLGELRATLKDPEHPDAGIIAKLQDIRTGHSKHLGVRCEADWHKEGAGRRRCVQRP